MKTRNELIAALTVDGVTDWAKYRETVRTYRAALDDLKNRVSTDRNENRAPAETIVAWVAAVGYDVAVVVLSSSIAVVGDWDARISGTVRAWANENGYDRESALDMRLYTDAIHNCHKDQLAAALMKYKPTEPEEAEQTAEPVTDPAPAETAASETNAEPAHAYIISTNPQFGSLEITFAEKPADSVRDALKALKFRWNGKRGLWYGFADAEIVRAALDGESAPATAGKVTETRSRKQTGKTAPKKEINLDGLDRNKKTTYGAEFAAVLRADLKARGVPGVTIRAGKSTYTDTITATITTTAEDYRSAEEAAARDGWRSFFNAENHGVEVDGIYYHAANQGRETETQKYISSGSAYNDTSEGSNFQVLRSFWLKKISRIDSINHHHITPENYREFTTEAFNRISAIVSIIQSYNWNRSDPMSDYYDVGFYLDVDIKKPADFQPRETMTDAEREQMEKDFAAEAEAERERFEAWQREQEEARKAEEIRAEQEKKDRAEIAASVSVVDLAENEQYYIFNLAGGIGKECTIEEVKERADRLTDAYITRRLEFTNAAALEKFGNMLLHDFDFLSGKGGTGTNDPRVTDENIMRLNSEQREKVKFYSVDCIAVYLNSKLQFVINPEGYNYARYTYIQTPETIEATPTASAEKTAADEAAQLQPFYFPAPVTDQAAALNVGSIVTIYQTDEWLLNIVRTITGTLTAEEPGRYAQYDGVFLTVKTGRKEERIFCTNEKKTVVFEGEAIRTPERIIYESVKETAGPTWKQYRDNGDQIKLIISMYADFGRVPVLDTIQR